MTASLDFSSSTFRPTSCVSASASGGGSSVFAAAYRASLDECLRVCQGELLAAAAPRENRDALVSRQRPAAVHVEASEDVAVVTLCTARPLTCPSKSSSPLAPSGTG